MRAVHFLFVLLAFPLLAQAGWSDFFGLFKRSDSTTTTPAPVTTDVPATTPLAIFTTTESNGACWWTQCGQRCTATATVHDFNGVNCNPGQYKFRCCSTT